MTNTANISARGLHAVSHFISSEVTRYYLSGVFIETAPEGGVNLVATDGHMIGVYHDAEGTVSEPTILAPSKALIKACKRYR